MNVLVGECTGGYVPEIQQLGWGRMWMARDRNIYTYPGEPWGLDNGAYRDWTNKPNPMPSSSFNAPAFLHAIDKALDQPRPILAVAPDLPGNPDSLGFSLWWMEHLPEPLPWYLAVQDGTTTGDVEPYVGLFHGIFLGGTNAYKATAGEWCDFAHGHGIRFHYGRCGTLAKVAHAIQVGADSIDSTTAMWERKKWLVFVEAITQGPPQHDLFWIGREI